jgi:acyl carrier protein
VLLQRLTESTGPERRGLLLSHLAETIRGLLGSNSVVPVAPTLKLLELGLKSLDLIDLKDRLESDFLVELPVTLFFSYSTLGTLAEHLLTEVLQLDDVPRGPRAIPFPGPSPSSAAGITSFERLAELSDEDAECGLLEKISDLEKRLK